MTPKITNFNSLSSSSSPTKFNVISNQLKTASLPCVAKNEKIVVKKFSQPTIETQTLEIESDTTSNEVHSNGFYCQVTDIVIDPLKQKVEELINDYELESKNENPDETNKIDCFHLILRFLAILFILLR